MTHAELDALCAAAMASIRQHINRAAGQHLRAMRKSFAGARHDTSTRLAVPTTRRPGSMDPRADRSVCPPAARAAATGSVLTARREHAADVVLSIVLGICLALLALHGLGALFF